MLCRSAASAPHLSIAGPCRGIGSLRLNLTKMEDGIVGLRKAK